MLLYRVLHAHLDKYNASVLSVDGSYGQWGVWYLCSVTCGQGIAARYRVCDDPPPLNGGFLCNRTEASSTRPYTEFPSAGKLIL